MEENGPRAQPIDDDAQLLGRAAAGDGRAFHKLVDRHGPRLYRLAAALVGNASDGEDVVQETLIGAYRSAGRFERRSSAKTWLTRILVTQAALCLRRRKRRSRERGEAATQEAEASDPGREVEQRLDVQAALEQLSDEHREVLVLREMEQMSYEEIAQVLQIPSGTVESRLHRARLQIREKLRVYWEK